MTRALRREVVFLAAACTGLTVAVTTSSFIRFGYRAPAMHVALETAAAVVAVLAAFLILGRLRREPRMDDLLLACGLAVLALSNLFFRAVPAATSDRNQRTFVWAAVVGRLLGALLLAAAASGSSRRLRGGTRTIRLSVLAAVAVLALAAALAELAGSHLPIAVRVQSAAITHPVLTGNPVLLAVQLVAALFYVVAVVGFVRRYERSGDEFIRWLALGCVLAVFSRINYFLYPTIYSDWVYFGDIFRLLFFLVLLVGALKEIASYWQRLAEAAALDERRRIARDFHDGLAQELAFIGRNLEALRPGDYEAVERLRRAAERAHDESRRAISALAAPEQASIESLLTQTASDLGDRLAVAIDLRIDGAAPVSLPRAEALVRIASEAITNAARHSGATTVVVSLRRAGAHCVLSVRDDGCGFDAAAETCGYGVISMRERAAAVGGTFALTSAPDVGTKVEVEL
jgi:signal transduction histidine kinase